MGINRTELQGNGLRRKDPDPGWDLMGYRESGDEKDREIGKDTLRLLKGQRKEEGQ